MELRKGLTEQKETLILLLTIIALSLLSTRCRQPPDMALEAVGTPRFTSCENCPIPKWTFDTQSVHTLSAVVFDVDGDGINDVIVPSQGKGNVIYALNGRNGEVLWEHTLGGVGADVFPSAADIDADGKVEVLVRAANSSRLCALNSEVNPPTGRVLWCYIDRKAAFWSSGSLFIDVNSDGILDVLSGSRRGTFWALNGNDGSVLWQINQSDLCWTVPSAGDIDDDGNLEIVLGMHGDVGDVAGGVFGNEIVVLNAEDGSLVWRYSIGDNTGSSSHAIIDLDEDGRLEIIASATDYDREAPNNEGIYVLEDNGTLKWSILTEAGHGVSVGDIDGDGQLEIVTGSYDCDTVGVIRCFGPYGELEWQSDFDGCNIGQLIVDIDGDGEVEILTQVSRQAEGDLRTHTIYVLNGANGQVEWSYALDMTGNEASTSNVIAADIDGDHKFEIIALGRDGIVRTFDANGNATFDEWLEPKANMRRTGNLWCPDCR